MTESRENTGPGSGNEQFLRNRGDSRFEYSSGERSDASIQETETQRAIREQWCNGCHLPRAEWGPVCPGMTVGDWTHYHSPEFWLYRSVR